MTLRTGSSEVDYPAQLTDASGFFTVTVSGLANGSYSYRVKGPKYLAKSGTVAMSGGPQTNVDIGLMRAGDANNDNLVNVLDFNILRSVFGTGFGNAGYDDRADFTGDRTITILDFNLVKSNFGLQGVFHE